MARWPNLQTVHSIMQIQCTPHRASECAPPPDALVAEFADFPSSYAELVPTTDTQTHHASECAPRPLMMPSWPNCRLSIQFTQHCLSSLGVGYESLLAESRSRVAPRRHSAKSLSSLRYGQRSLLVEIGQRSLLVVGRPRDSPRDGPVAQFANCPFNCAALVPTAHTQTHHASECAPCQ